MKTKVTLLAIAVLVSGIALAQTPATAPGPHEAERMDRMALLLDLDAYQKTEVAKVLNEQHDQMRAAREASRTAGERPSREEMKAQHEKADQELKTKLSSILNETQLKKFDALREGRGHGPGRFGNKDRGSKDQTPTN